MFNDECSKYYLEIFIVEFEFAVILNIQITWISNGYALYFKIHDLIHYKSRLLFILCHQNVCNLYYVYPKTLLTMRFEFLLRIRIQMNEWIMTFYYKTSFVSKFKLFAYRFWRMCKLSCTSGNRMTYTQYAHIKSKILYPKNNI